MANLSEIELNFEPLEDNARRRAGKDFAAHRKISFVRLFCQ